MECYLVRHCEKIEWGDDPPLTETGKRRADALAGALAGVDLRKVVVTTLRRTLETAQPSIDALVPEGSRASAALRLGPGAYARTVEEVWSQHVGATLVVGHMQTIPALVRRIAARGFSTLGVPYPECVRYGDLFVLTGDEGGVLTLSTRRFGDAPAW